MKIAVKYIPQEDVYVYIKELPYRLWWKPF